MVFSDQFLDLLLRGRDLCRSCGGCRINDCRIEHFSGSVHDCQLAARAECRIPSQNHLPCDRRLHEKLFQVLSKHLHRALFRLLCELISDLTLNCRGYQALIAVLGSSFQHRLRRGIFSEDHLLFQIAQDVRLLDLQADCEELLLLPAV